MDPSGKVADSIKNAVSNALGLCKMNGDMNCDFILKKGRNFCIKNAGFGMYICMQAVTEMYGECMFDNVKCWKHGDKNETCK